MTTKTNRTRFNRPLPRGRRGPREPDYCPKYGLFQPALRREGGGDQHALGGAVTASGFQPALRRGGGGDGLGSRGCWAGSRFNPPSAAEAEGTRLPVCLTVPGFVSTRPPPRRRRGLPTEAERARYEKFQPALRRGGGGDVAVEVAEERFPVFQPALRRGGGGDWTALRKKARPRQVSTRPPPRRRRGRPPASPRGSATGSFNPPSAAEAEGTLRLQVSADAELLPRSARLGIEPLCRAGPDHGANRYSLFNERS